MELEDPGKPIPGDDGLDRPPSPAIDTDTEPAGNAVEPEVDSLDGTIRQLELSGLGSQGCTDGAPETAAVGIDVQQEVNPSILRQYAVLSLAFG